MPKDTKPPVSPMAESYAAARMLLQALGGISAAADIVDHALVVETQIGALEKKLATINDQVAAMNVELAQAQKAHAAALADLEHEKAAIVAERDAEQRGLESDRAAREHAARVGAAAMKQAHDTATADLRQESSRLGVVRDDLRREVDDLKARKLGLQAELRELLARHSAA